MTVSLLAGARLGDSLRDALLADVFELTQSDGTARVRFLTPQEAVDADEVHDMVTFVLGGGGLLLALDGGPPSAEAWPLLNAFHLFVLSPLDPQPARATSHPAMAGIEAVALESPVSVAGVGHSLLRVGADCAALAAPRGEGRVLFLGCSSPLLSSDPVFGLACLRWISRQTPDRLR